MQALSLPEAEYNDLSPKGSVDANIRDFIDEINNNDGCVTTSSCSGRLVVFAEGLKGTGLQQDGSEDQENNKGMGGRWLLVSHDPVAVPEEHLSTFLSLTTAPHRAYETSSSSLLATSRRLIHLKFEPFILHLLAASLNLAQSILRCAQQAGFRESGIAGINDAGVAVAVRTHGLGISSVVGHVDEQGRDVALVDEAHLALLLEVANKRFQANHERIQRFREGMKKSFESTGETKAERAERKRSEGLRKQKEIADRHTKQRQDEVPLESSSIDPD